MRDLMAHFARLGLVAVALAASLALPMPGEARSLRARESDLQRQQRIIAEQLAEKRLLLQQLKAKEHHAVQDLTVVQQRLEQTSTELQDSQFRLRKAEHRLSLTAGQLQSAESRLRRQQDSAAARLRAIYKNRALDGWEALLTAPDMTTFLTRYQYFKRISEHDATMLDDLFRTRRAINQQREQFALQRWNIARVTQAIGTQKLHLTDLEGSKKVLVSKIKTERQAAEQVVAQLEADNASLAAMIQRIIAQRRALELAARRNPRYVRPFIGTGRFMWPVAGVITSPFGQRMHPILGRYVSHHGIDFGAASGTPIYASDSGEVIYAGWYGGYGKVVIIDHGKELTTLYGHTSSYVVSAGARVRKGQVVAYVGSTGMSTGPHLHFEIRSNGAAVNPAAYIR
ncbi:MAG: peptidoglycan DD-metalloendopeptidase family protein [Candidatus Sericytochromatia bacterium]|nr:peptidoglycan DD-metalloendopeptidase family protein [Candidatus Sericytochromatia bacterium]